MPHMCVSNEDRKRVLNLLRLELQVVLQTELLYSARAVYAFNLGAISPVTSITLTSIFSPNMSHSITNKEVIIVCCFDTDK